MNTKISLITTLFVLSIIFSKITASDQSSATSSWEQHSEGIALALTLRGNSIIVDIKNTSKTTKDILGSESNSGVKLFYINDQGSKVLLGKRSNPSNPWDDITQSHVGPVAIPPGGNQSRIIAITSDELALLKTHSVVCSVLIDDPATKQQSTIESTPKLLTETSGK